MSASYIHRDPLVLNPSTLQLLPSKNGTLGCQNDSFMVSSGRSYLDRPVSSSSPSCPTKRSPPAPQPQVSLQSPKMSPDSTLTHHQPPSTTTSSATPVSRFTSNTSPGNNGFGQRTSSCASSSSSIGDGFLRSALTSVANPDNANNAGLNLHSACHLSESHGVGSSTGNGLSILDSMSSATKANANPAAMMAMMMRPRAMTSNLTRSVTPTKIVSTATASSSVPASAPTPSSTTPVKKSSRRNPWGSETYSDLISIAIHSYPDQQATLQQIYDFIISNYEYFRERSDPTSSAGWKNSIRHNLSLHDRFTKCPKSSDNTKSSYWRINTEVASKPYVRRRACSMDTNNLKRSGSNHCGKASNRNTGGAGHRGNALHQSGDKPGPGGNLGSRLSSLMPPLSEIHCPTLPPLLTPSDAMQARPDSQQSTGSRQNPARSAFTKTYLGANKLPSYFSYPPSGVGATLGKPGPPNLLASSQNEMTGRWGTPKFTQTAFRASGYPNLTASSYMYDQGAGSLPFESTDFNTILGSTDQALVRSRASGLIEQLLCSDHPMGAMLGTGKPVPPAPSAQTAAATAYLPNAFGASNPLVSSLSVTNEPHRMAMDSGPNFSHDLIVSHSPAVDLRQHTALHTGSLLSDGSGDNRSGLAQQPLSHQLQHQQHHHLRPVPMQGCSSASDMTNSTFSASWNPYMQQFNLPSSAGHAAVLSGNVNNMNYSVFNGNGSFHPHSDSHQLSDSKVKYESIETMASGHHHNNSQQHRLSFLSAPQMASLPPSPGNSIGSSANPWRQALSLDVSQHTDQQRLSSGNASLTPLSAAASPSTAQSNNARQESRSLGPPVTPPNPLYYSPMRVSLSSMYGSSECALDTPPYQQQQTQSLKSEPLDIMDASGNLGTSAVSSASTVDYDTSSQTSSVTRHSAYTASCGGGGGGGGGLRTRSDNDADSEMSARFAEAYPYDDDCEPLELELSLELADRIVGSTRSDSKS